MKTFADAQLSLFEGPGRLHPGAEDGLILQTLPLAKPTFVYDTLWRFAAERQEVFFRKWAGSNPPWTDDQIIARHKFTNPYRASDRVSQYLIRNVIYQGDQSAPEVFFRTILFKLFNKVETWDEAISLLRFQRDREGR